MRILKNVAITISIVIFIIAIILTADKFPMGFWSCILVGFTYWAVDCWNR